MTSPVSNEGRRPRYRLGKILRIGAAVWVFIFCGLYLMEAMCPRPSATIKRDFMAAAHWIDSYRTEHGQLPSQDEFQHFLVRASLIDRFTYQQLTTGEYVLKIWDGENRWTLSSGSKGIIEVSE